MLRIEDDYWARDGGPLRKDVDFTLEFLPPLSVAWEHGVPPMRFGSSQRVGGGGRVFITTGRSDVQALDVERGKFLWEVKGCRVEHAYFYFAASLVWVMNGPGGTIIDAVTGARKDLALLNFFSPIGVFREDSEIAVWIPKGRFYVSRFRLEPQAGFDAIASRGQRLLGFFKQHDPVSIACMNVVTRDYEWVLPAGEGSGIIRATSNEIFLAYTQFLITARSFKDGRKLWTMEYNNRGYLPHLMISDNLVFQWDHGVICAYDAGTGEQRWKSELKDADPTNLIGTRGLIWVGICARESRKKDRLVALDKRTGEEVWSLPVKGKFVGDYPLSFIDGSLICAIGRTITCFRPEAA